MATEAQFVAALTALCARTYADYAEGTPARPYVTYQQVGGEAVNFLEGGVGGRRNARMQVNVWADTRLAATTLMHSIEDVLKASPFYADAIGARISRADPTTKLRGAQQDFSFWPTA